MGPRSLLALRRACPLYVLLISRKRNRRNDAHDAYERKDQREYDGAGAVGRRLQNEPVLSIRSRDEAEDEVDHRQECMQHKCDAARVVVQAERSVNSELRTVIVDLRTEAQPYLPSTDHRSPITSEF